VHINQSPERSLIGEVNGASYGATQAFDGMRGSVRTPVYQLTEASAMKAAEPGAITILSGPPSPAKTTVARILLETAEKPTAHLVTDSFYVAIK
jgi:hypothetical protein